MDFINSSMLISVLLLGVAAVVSVPVTTIAVTAGTFGANADPVVEGIALVTVGITSGG